MKYLSVCSGIEAATVAWHPLGWKPFAFAEIEPFPAAVLAHHYPETPNLGDMTRFKEWPDAAIDLLVGGTPCQSFSVAGLRKGLDDPRGNLALVYLAIAARYRPRWLVWENVPGVLSSNGGRDFGAFLGGLGQLGYGFAYRVLDAQYFGVPQRRRRVFVVGHLGDWRAAAAVLFERHSLQGHPAPRREAGEGTPGTVTARTCRSVGADDAANGHLIAAKPLLAGGHSNNPLDENLIAHTLRGEGFDASEDGTGRGTPLVPVAHVDVLPTMLNGANTPNGHNARSGHTKDSYIVPVSVALRGRDGGATAELGDDIAGCLRASSGGGDKPHVLAQSVRRLTPRECERLQGFPDDYTAIPYRSKPAADGPRYKALGNSMAVPCMRWIGQRISQVQAVISKRAAA